MLDHTVTKERFASRAFQSRFTNQFEGNNTNETQTVERRADGDSNSKTETPLLTAPSDEPLGSTLGVVWVSCDSEGTGMGDADLRVRVTRKEASEARKNLIAVLTKAKETCVGVCGKSAGTDASTWRRISIAVDSGACDNVISPDDVPEQQVMESSGSKKGENFYSATGEPIPNLGDIKLPMIMREGTARGMLMRAAPVSKPLASVKKICQAGHAVIFDEEGSFIINKTTGEMNWMREDDGNYMLDAWVPPPESPNEDFIRQP